MIIITGHGNFGSGLKSSLDLIVGNFDFVKVVDFTEEKSPDILKKEIVNHIDDRDRKIYIFTDLVGGTPFKVSSELTLKYSNIEVICGTNLPMLIECAMMMSLDCDIDINSIKDTGINSIKPPAKTVEFDGDGI